MWVWNWETSKSVAIRVRNHTRGNLTNDASHCQARSSVTLRRRKCLLIQANISLRNGRWRLACRWGSSGPSDGTEQELELKSVWQQNSFSPLHSSKRDKRKKHTLALWDVINMLTRLGAPWVQKLSWLPLYLECQAGPGTCSRNIYWIYKERQRWMNK